MNAFTFAVWVTLVCHPNPADCTDTEFWWGKSYIFDYTTKAECELFLPHHRRDIENITWTFLETYEHIHSMSITTTCKEYTK